HQQYRHLHYLHSFPTRRSSDLDLIFIVVISAINAVTAGIIKAALTPPSNLEAKSISTVFPSPNNNSEKLKINKPIIIIGLRPKRSTHLPAKGDISNWLTAK